MRARSYIFIGLLSLFLLPGLASAQANNTRGILISPPRVENNLAPGEVYQDQIRVTNNDNDEITFYIYPADFVADPKEGGAPKFLESPDPEGFSSWVTTSEKSLTLRSGETKKISYTVTVPSTAEPGLHYGAIIFSRQKPNPSEGVKVNVTSEIGTLVFATVKGKLVQHGEIATFATTKKVYTTLPVSFVLRFKNSGNVQLKPMGIIEVYNFRKQREQVIQFNKQFGTILPQSTRRFVEKWSPAKWFGVIPPMGLYEAKGTLSYGNPEVSLALGPVRFWIIPVTFLLKALGVIFAVLLTVVLIIRAYVKRLVKKQARKR